jgi:hypothetical protein
MLNLCNLHGEGKAWKNLWGAGQGARNVNRIQAVQ